MKKIILALIAASFVAACDTPGETVLLGAATGAAIGNATSGRNETEATLIGAAVGAVAGAAVAGANSPPQCKYVYPDGHEVVADCPE
ncbi:glycine zipper domain-containing protein [Actibacterium sp.]|uniref:glycine zipper domain-containing protein n=1 Tax=Actibacterium sp. TaxID=1872125 RepID=UPI003564882A